jgi:hypothetical protein
LRRDLNSWNFWARLCDLLDRNSSMRRNEPDPPGGMKENNEDSES